LKPADQLPSQEQQLGLVRQVCQQTTLDYGKMYGVLLRTMDQKFGLDQASHTVLTIRVAAIHQVYRHFQPFELNQH
jgi:hypothetical protein